MTSSQHISDIEASSASIPPLDGFPSLADFIASDQDRTSLVFKRFDRLAIRNLLYLQSELSDLQAQQEAFDAQDQSFQHGSRESKECAMNWERFKDAAEKGDAKQKERMALVRKIRQTIKDYSVLPTSTLPSSHLNVLTYFQEKRCC
jgi:hypothetical protein